MSIFGGSAGPETRGISQSVAMAKFFVKRFALFSVYVVKGVRYLLTDLLLNRKCAHKVEIFKTLCFILPGIDA